MSTSESTHENTARGLARDGREAAEEGAPPPAFIRLQVELVVEITDLEALTGTALEAVAAEYEDALPDPDDHGTEGERRHAESLVRADAAEALASLIDPFDLVSAVPGIELAQASWSSEAVEHDFDDDDDHGADAYEYYDADDEEGEQSEAGGRK
ncbi:hypothetical protein [Streptomyces sp. NBC_00247]|uniref:hypothetical protein n=1 Tax=Streptomyces sp. NBC_00247 TaxID=2975689 RepID=UPI003FA6D876